MPVFIPCPPVGGCTWAASPARNTRPDRNRCASRILGRHTVDHTGSPTMRSVRPLTRSSRSCRTARVGRGSSPSGAANWNSRPPGNGVNATPAVGVAAVANQYPKS